MKRTDGFGFLHFFQKLFFIKKLYNKIQRSGVIRDINLSGCIMDRFNALHALIDYK